MDALIMSCSTGGGHNSAGYAVMEELKKRGHNVTMLDPYDLVGKRLSKTVGNGYIKIAQKTPRLFGFIYFLGNMYRRLPIHSPVYAVNKSMLGKMREYLENNHYDVIIMPHIYPGEILTNMKNKGMSIPKTIFVATDYVCIPFTEEIDCDCYITPCDELNADFIRRGIAKEKLYPLGIPVKHIFSEKVTRTEAINKLGLDESKKYILVAGGSFGAGSLKATIRTLKKYTEENSEYNIIVLCGSNEKLLNGLRSKYGNDAHITLLPATDKIALYMKASEVFLSKPGGLSSTEAAVSGTPLIHLAPIPGCETENMKFFSEKGMSIAVGNSSAKLVDALNKLKKEELVTRMKENQHEGTNSLASTEICDLVERIVG